jgi:hypothetical protein
VLWARSRRSDIPPRGETLASGWPGLARPVCSGTTGGCSGSVLSVSDSGVDRARGIAGRSGTRGTAAERALGSGLPGPNLERALPVARPAPPGPSSPDDATVAAAGAVEEARALGPGTAVGPARATLNSGANGPEAPRQRKCSMAAILQDTGAVARLFPGPPSVALTLSQLVVIEVAAESPMKIKSIIVHVPIRASATVAVALPTRRRSALRERCTIFRS